MLKALNNSYEDFMNICNTLIEKDSTGIILIDTNGTIKYANPAIGELIQCGDFSGSNIFEHEAVRRSRLYYGILRAIKGFSTEIKKEYYQSFHSGIERYVDLYVNPEVDLSTKEIKHILILVKDVTEE